MPQRGEVQPRDVGREAAIQEFVPLIKYVVRKLSPRLPAAFDHEDLISYGLIGLIDAWDRFDAGRGVKFETYAVTRIRGAIIDAIRGQDRLSRTSRQHARRIDQATCSLTNQLGRMPSRSEMASALGVPVRAYDAMLREASWATVSIDVNPFEADDDRPGVFVPADSNIPDFSDALVRGETRQALAKAVAALPERDLMIVSLYYAEGLTMKEIAKVLDVSATRVCQLHARAIARLRERMAEVAAA